MAKSQAKEKTETKKKVITTKKVETTIEGVKVPLKWNIPDNIVTRYASNVAVQILENEFKVSFFEINPEIRTDNNQKIPKEIQANCVASVIMSPGKFPSFIAALQQQLEIFLKLKSQKITDNLKVSSSTEP